MIDLEGMLLPDDMPEPGACIRVERPEDGLARIVLDPPNRTLAVLDMPLIRDLDVAVDGLRADSSLKGVVICGRRPDQFAAGADVKAIEAVEDRARLEKLVCDMHGLLMRIDTWPVRTVAAVGGPVPGGAFELSMACDWIVALDDKRTRIGLPETQLGILPAWGGTHRLPRRVGVPKALEAILSGRLYPVKAAWKSGMVDRITKAEWLLDVADAIAMGRETPRRKSRGAKAWLVDRNPIAGAIIGSMARKQILARTRGRYPAPLRVLDLVIRAPRVPLSRWARTEAAVAGELATGPICKSLISIFFASEAAKKSGRMPDGSAAAPIERGAVIGAGVMGGGIASVLAEKGVSTRLVDLSAEAVDATLVDHRLHIGKKLKRRRTERHEAEAAIDCLDGSRELVGLRRSQIVIEAVAERIEVKRKVFGAVCEQVGDDTILATNTSSLSVDEIAEGLPAPERVVGMHFFNPVRKMPLVEVIRGPRTDEEVAVRVASLALRMGKTPVVVKDVAGFLVNRILSPYLDEAMQLFAAGADVENVDRVLLDFGMPMGPFTLLDEVGFDIAMHAGQSLQEAYGERMTACTVLNDFVKPDRLGKKTGRGFYRHDPRRKRPVFDSAVNSWRTGDSARGLSDEQIVDRVLLPMVNEAARCLEEDVVASPQLLDLATVFGTGFAPFRGGLLRWADTLGAATVVERIEKIAQRPEVRDRPGGLAKFTPAESLVELAATGRAFHGSRSSSGTPVEAAPST